MWDRMQCNHVQVTSEWIEHEAKGSAVVVRRHIRGEHRVFCKWSMFLLFPLYRSLALDISDNQDCIMDHWQWDGQDVVNEHEFDVCAQLRACKGPERCHQETHKVA